MGARVVEFLESRLARHHSVRTVEWTESNLRRFLEWCEERSLRNPTEVTRPILERYQRWCFYYRTKAGRPLSVASQHKRLAAVLAFFRWMARGNLILFNPASELELPRLDRRLPRQVLSISEVEQILSLPDVTALGGIRDRAILETLYSTGIRRSELVNLGLYDVQADAGTLMVRLGKGRKDRVVPIGERALGWIEKYLIEVRPHLVVEPDDGALFVSHLGHGFTPHHLTDIVRDYIEKAAIGKTGSCHLFRHTMATLMLESGADIRFIPGDARAREAGDDEHLHVRVDPEAEGGARADAPRVAARAASAGEYDAGGGHDGCSTDDERRGRGGRAAFFFSCRGCR
jgi:integrase/recombinase XerD